MTMTHRGRPVKWIGADTGWKTGHVVAPGLLEVTRKVLVPSKTGHKVSLATLAQHSCTGQIEFVLDGDLSPWQTREEWEVESE
jgi:hypothetical protein